MTSRRPWLAAAFSLLYPGVGHVYLREWARAVLWFGLALVISVLVIPPDVAGSGIGPVLMGRVQVPIAVTLSFLFLRALSAIDAYQLATSGRIGSATEKTKCSRCGRELDTDLEFCHWCSARVDHE